MSKKRLFSAVATLIGCIIGAGILGIPSVVAKAGFLTGLLDLVIIGLLFLLVNLYLGEVMLRTKGDHQLIYYADKYLGHAGKKLMFISIILGIYGSLIAYIIGQGAAVAKLFGISDFVGSIIVFSILSFLIYIGLNAVEDAEDIIVPAAIFIIIVLSAASLAKIIPTNLLVFSPKSLALPYGVLFFAFMGASAMPSVKEELRGSWADLKKAVIIGSLVPLGIYIIFALSMVGVLGTGVNEIAALSFGDIIGESYAFFGSLLAMLTMTTSFLVLGLALKEIFRRDYGLRRNSAWMIACLVPFAFYIMLKLSGLASFQFMLNLTGTITGVITMVLIILMVLAAKKYGTRKPEYTIYINKWIAAVLIIFILLGGILNWVL